MNKKIIFGLIGAGVVAVVAIMYFSSGGPGLDVLGTQIELAVFDGGGILYLPFIKDLPESAKVTVKMGDSNEVLAENISIKPRGNWRSGIPATFTSAPAENTRIVITIGNKEYERKIAKVTQETADLMELEKVTKPEEAMKGWGGVALAQAEPATEAYRHGLPDITQRIAECAPTAAANSLISLADEHGATDMPGDRDLIDELKRDMDWTPENGVIPPDFVEGKNKWAARHGLPIRTEMVGGQRGEGTLQSILDAMSAEGGAAAEIRLKFTDAKGKVNGGHMVTITGVRTEGGQTFIDVNDPLTPEGTETYEIDGNRIKGYPRRAGGLAFVSFGFVQRWEESGTGIQLDPMTDEEIRGIQRDVGVKEKIKVIIYGQYKIPLGEVHVAKPDKCNALHYHANNGVVTDIDGNRLPDPNNTGNSCGYGKVSEVPVAEVELP